MVNVISRNEFNRIKASLKDDGVETSKQERRAQLKALSNERVQHWPNTLEAMRRKKESFLKDKREKEELGRQEIDRQEAERRKVERLDAIQRANELLYEQRDKMKTLRSQIMLADVLADRDVQVVENKVIKESYREEARQDHENILRKVKELEEIEAEKIRKREEAAKAVAITRVQQREEAKGRRQQEKHEEFLIGQRLKEEAQKRVEDEIIQQHEKFLFAKKKNLEFKEVNEELKVVRMELIRKEKEAEAERDAQLGAIEDRKQAIKNLEVIRFNKAQETRQLLIDRAVEQLKKTNNAEELRFQKQVREAHEKQEREFQAKELHKQEQLRLLKEAREYQIKIKEEGYLRSLDEESKMVALWRIQYDKDVDEERTKEAAAQKIVKDLKHEHLQEGARRQRNRVEDRIREIERQKYLDHLADHDDDRFVKLTKEKIDEYSKAGKPTYPLQKALETTEIVLLPAKTVKINEEK